MNVIAFASRKGGSGKSTLTAHLAAHADKASRRCLLLDADPQGSLSLWHKLRGTGTPILKPVSRNLAEVVKAARGAEFDWVLIDTPPNQSAIVSEAIRAATLVIIPARPAVFDLMAVQDTIALARELRTPYAVVVNSAPAKRDEQESPIVAQARAGLAKMKVPVWAGQITQRTNLALSLASGEGAREFAPDSQAAGEIAQLWSAIEKSVRAIRGVQESREAMHRAAA